MNIRNLLAVLFATAMPVAMLGCASASSATDSTFSYIRGDQRAKLGATPPQISAATVAAAKELDLPVDSQSADGLVGKVMMHTADATKVEVNIKAEASDQSDVTVRVGTFGDKALQQRMLDKIKAHLGEGAVTATRSPMAASPALMPPALPAPVVEHRAPANPLAPAGDGSAPPANPLAPGPAPATLPSGF